MHLKVELSRTICVRLCHSGTIGRGGGGAYFLLYMQRKVTKLSHSLNYDLTV